MFFQIDNTPEPVKKQRKKLLDENNEDIPTLKLAPFSGTPIVTFDSILLGQQVSRCLQLYNPSENTLQISISKFPPEELNLHVSWTEKCIAPHETCPLEILWNPVKAIAQRVNIQFVDHKKGRFDAVIICKSIASKTNKTGGKKKMSAFKPTTFKKSPKRLSPRKNTIFLNNIKKKENVFTVSTELTHDVSIEIKKHTRPITKLGVMAELPRNAIVDDDDELSKVLRRETYFVSKPKPTYQSPQVQNFPSNILSAIEDLKFTPLRTCDPPMNESSDKENTYVKATPIRLKVNDTEMNMDDLIDKLDFTPLKCNSRLKNIEPKQVFGGSTELVADGKGEMIPKNILRERKISNVQIYKPEPNILSVTHTIIDLVDDSVIKPENVNTKETAPESFGYLDNCSITFDNLQSNSFTPNNKSSESLFVFNPKRFSTEKKSISEKSHDEVTGNNTGETFNVTYDRLSSSTYIKVGDSPIVPINPESDHLQSSPFSICDNSPVFIEPPIHRSTFVKKLPFGNGPSSGFNERTEMRNANKEKNFTSSIQSIIGADLWPKNAFIRSTSPTSLSIIPEESITREMSYSFAKKPHFETFVVDKTSEKSDYVKTAENQTWKKSSVKHDPIIKQEHDLKIIENVASENFEYINIKSIATTIDPFLAATCLYDEKAYEEMESEFKMWLNYLLTPPAEFDTDSEDKKVDFGKAWIESRNKNIPLAPTKEQVSSKYHTSHRLESLRKAAKIFVSKPEITQVFLKVANQIERKILAIRVDKNIHLDIGLQKIILHLLKCYNPLWLRIALETIYGKNVKLSSNDDFVGLSEFITENLFKDPYIQSKHATTAASNVFLPSYAENVKRFTLKKFLYIVFFLDRAKECKMIPHDPCLFRRNAPYKESREILIQFAKEVLAGVGDITKHLRPTGYIVSHKQSYLNEFKYAVHNIAVDLKDGVRLTRLMEIILMQDNLLTSMRTPAISRLQKVHNVKVALTALESAGFKIVGDITPKDIADGHREKTLSLLWQLINKFRAPLFERAAIVLQKWWRRKLLKVILEKRIQHRKLFVFHKAATIIQSKWRQVMCRKRYLDDLETKTKACIQIQKTWRAYKSRQTLRKQIHCSVTIQRWYRKLKTMQAMKQTLKYNRERNAVIVIQRWFRKKRAVQIGKTCEERVKYLSMKKSAISLQTAFRAHLKMKKARKIYVVIRESTVKIQQFYRSIVLRRKVQKQYLELKASTITLQRIFRANREMQYCKTEYIKTRKAAISIQRHYRGYKLKKEAHNNFLALKRSTIAIQNRYRALILMRIERKRYLELQRSATTIQQFYRAQMQMIQTRNSYLKQRKSAITIQRSFRSYIEKKRRINAALLIQRFYRNQKLCTNIRQIYIHKRQATILIQQKYRAILKMRNDREKYILLKMSTSTIQSRFRAQLAMRKQREIFIEMKNSALIIQRCYRRFITLKRRTEAAACIQRHFRNYIISRDTRKDYLMKRDAAIVIQRHFRASVTMKSTRKTYLCQLQSIITIQTYFRAYLAMRLQLANYLKMRQSAITIQRCFRNYVKNKKEDNAARVIQRFYRNYSLNKKTRDDYMQFRLAVIFIQQMYRFKLYIIKKRIQEQNQAAVAIQQYYRGYINMKKTRKEYLDTRRAVLKMQEIYRANKMCKETRSNYLLLKKSAVLIQRYYKAKKMMEVERQQYLALQNAAITIQRRYRARVLMLSCVDYYETVRCAAIQIQTWYRSAMWLKRMKAAVIKQREINQVALMEKSATIIQSQWKGYMARNYFYTARVAVTMIQKWYKSILEMRQQQSEYTNLREATVKIQSYWRCYQARKKYLALQKSAISCQRIYRAKIAMRKDHKRYNQIRGSVILLQALCKGRLQRKRFQEMITNKKEMQLAKKQMHSAIVIQRCWRGYNVRKKQAADSKAAELRRRWANGGLNSNQLSLAERNEDAMDVLTHFKDISSIIRAFKTLDYVSNVYPMMYNSEESVTPIISRLVLYIDSTNRSVSTLETIQLAASILVNLAKYKPTSSHVYNEANMNVFLKLMLRWCDKDSLLSRLLCTLIWILGKYEPIHKEISKTLSHPENYKTLCRVRSLLVRKKRMDSRKRSSIILNTPIKTEPRRSMTPVKMGRPLQKLELPSLNPDYGVIQSKRPRIFADDIQAIESVFFKYKLELSIVTDV